MKHYFIVNPEAGKGKMLASLLTKIRFASEELGIDYTVYNTTTTGDGTRYVKEVCEKHPDEDLRFYACGGDGTLYEVVNGAVGHHGAQVAVVPTGTGNDFVRNFTGSENFLNIKHQILGTPKKIDLLKCNGRYCINVTNIGLDCEVVQKTDELKRSVFIPGQFAYYAAIISKFFGKFGNKIKVAVDDGPMMEYNLTLIAMGNGCYYGGGFKAMSRAYLDDGLIDLCMITDATKADFIKAIADYKKGTHVNKLDKFPFIKYKKCRKVEISTEKAMGACVDGEIFPFRHLTVEIVPSALNFVIPRGSGYVSGNTKEGLAAVDALV